MKVRSRPAASLCFSSYWQPIQINKALCGEAANGIQSGASERGFRAGLQSDARWLRLPCVVQGLRDYMSLCCE
ncbi:hypothetical protein JOQ06_028413 [Pogonophryne albipinna]|uniref:Uncharacterized protein n=1 Tax=Pogonophryne albipinna TaxID=1090488 RepID=A0AAD6BA18_9TELE|nr:hypothetical protein JOQ06_028413 [Pogonophryne albipinna]